MNMSPKPLMEIVKNSLGKDFHTSDRQGYCNLSGNEITDYHSVKCPYNSPGD